MLKNIVKIVYLMKIILPIFVPDVKVEFGGIVVGKCEGTVVGKTEGTVDNIKGMVRVNEADIEGIITGMVEANIIIILDMIFYLITKKKKLFILYQNLG